MEFETNEKIVLASASPRRKEILEKLNISFDTMKSDVVEEVNEEARKNLKSYAETWALSKASAVFKRVGDAVVIGADTIVGRDTEVFPKPNDQKEARTFLQSLSGTTHSVVTGVAIVSHGIEKVFSVETEVEFYALDDAFIEAYIRTEDPYDKAGAYGIQSGGAVFVKEIRGDYYAVMGLPIAELTKQLRELGVLSLKGGA